MSYIGYNGIVVHSKYDSGDFPNEEGLYKVTLIDGKTSYKRPIGYCFCDTHRGYISKELLKSHKCLQKQCPFLRKNEEHPYWNDREKRREDKKLKKFMSKTYTNEEMALLICSQLFEFKSDVKAKDKLIEDIGKKIREISNDGTAGYEEYDKFKKEINEMLDDYFL